MFYYIGTAINIYPLSFSLKGEMFILLPPWGKVGKGVIIIS
jgi:hypothetical protein